MNHELFPDAAPGRAGGSSQSVASTTFTRELLEALLAGATTPPSFEDCAFDMADLSRLDLSGCHFTRCTVVEASFFGAQLNGTRWRSCRGRQADFGAADLHDATFHACDLNNTSWRRAKLASVSFSESKLTGATFEHASTLGLQFRECLLIGADLRGMSFRKATLDQLDFSDADLDGADFRDAVFSGGSLRDALLKNARFAGADLRDADLGGLRLTDAAQFRGATISHAQAAMLMEELGLRVA